MAKTQLKCLLFWVFILFSPVTKGVNGQCSTPPINQAVYEGTQNTFLTCNSPTKVSWYLKPTTDELSTFQITNYNDIVAPTYTSLFGVNSTGLNVKTAQTSQVTPPISTSGAYIIKINGSTTQYGAKLVVVRVGPTCLCKTLNSSNIQLNCSLTYADYSGANPINAKMTWTADGNYYRNDTPVRTRPNSKEYISSSVQTVNGYYPPSYQCTVTFVAPTPTVAYIAKNAPAFSASCTVPFCGYTTPEPAETTSPTTAEPTTTTAEPTTTTAELTTTTSPTTAEPTTTTAEPTTTTAELTTTTSPTTAEPTTTTAEPTTTTSPTTTTAEPTTTTAEPTTTTSPTTAEPTITTTAEPTTTTSPITAEPTTTTSPTTTTTAEPTTTTSPITTTAQPTTTTTAEPTTTTSPITAELTSTTSPPPPTTTTTTTTAEPTTTAETTTTTSPTTTEPTTTTLHPTPTGSSFTTGCDCSQTTGCPSLDQNCTEANECRSVGTDLTSIYEECVVKAELYAKCDNCCPESLVCGVVVTLRNDSRWLIHDPLCNDNRCQMMVFDASCMSSGWKLLTNRKVMISGVGDYVQTGNGVQIGQNATDCSESCKRMMLLP